MRAIITIFKAEFKGKESIQHRLSELSTVNQQVEAACIYCPLPGKLFEFLTLLRENKIAYGTHFNTVDDQLEEIESQNQDG